MIQYIRRNDYETVQLDGEWIVLNTDDYTIIKLNGVGGYCWSLLGGTQSIDSLVQAVRKEYESVDETVETDVEAFLTDLLERGLVQHAVS